VYTCTAVKQVAKIGWLQINCLILAFVRSDYILPSLVRAVGPYSSRLDDRAVRASLLLVLSVKAGHVANSKRAGVD
jgi:hypothetical protein